MTAPRSSPGPRLLSDEERALWEKASRIKALWHNDGSVACLTCDDALSLLTALSTAREAGERDATDAARWRALVACPRVRILGGASQGYPEGRGLLGVEFYGTFPFIDQDGAADLTEFADGLVAHPATSTETPHA